MLYTVSFAYHWRFRNAGDPVPSIISFFNAPMMPQVQEAGVSGSHNFQSEDCDDENSGNKMKEAKYEWGIPHDEVQIQYPDSKDGGADADDEGQDEDDFVVPGDD